MQLAQKTMLYPNANYRHYRIAENALKRLLKEAGGSFALVQQSEKYLIQILVHLL